MFEVLDAQRRNVDQLSIIRQRSLTDLYRTNSYITQLQVILQRTEASLNIYERLNPSLPRMNINEKKRYAELLNNIATQAQLLKATLQAMDDNLKILKETNNIEQGINGNISRLRNQANKFSKKIEKILNKNAIL